ncbi:hypothetical protein IJT17_01580 [bacterium]|nr:hypothetical protein [bacterium]
MSFRKSHGMVLIMTMMAICLVLIMVYSLTQTTGLGLSGMSSFYNREAALQAAQSGIDYAVTRLQYNHGWRGDANCKYWSGEGGTDKPEVTYGAFDRGFLVGESNGNVVGLLRSKSGALSAFRLKFSYEDNSSSTYSKAVRSRFGLENTDDYMPSFPIRSPYVCVNNLLSTAVVPVYRAAASGQGTADSTANLELDPDTGLSVTERAFAMHLPAQRVYLVAEGLSGNGLRDCTTLSQVNDVANSGIQVTKRYIETYYTTNAPIVNGDAAFAEGQIALSVKEKAFVSTQQIKLTSDVSVNEDKSTVPASGSLRSNSSMISVSGGTLNTFNGKLIHSEGKKALFNCDNDTYTFLNSKGEKQDYTFPDNAEEIINTQVERLAWKDVAKVTKSASNNLLAGFYQWCLAPGSEPGHPRYYLCYFKDGYSSMRKNARFLSRLRTSK